MYVSKIGVLSARAVLSIVGMAVTILVLGPFQGAEEAFGLSDKEAHAIAFFVLTLLLQASAPRIRRVDIALGCAGLGALIEVAQYFTGRSMSFSDWMADVVGISFALLPMYVERLRFTYLNPQLAFKRRASDRRSGRKTRRRAANPSTYVSESKGN